ncbi:helix-turn-helix domain-containing protein [uncultured Selenomonas sp.]|uniref:helix-turn-helix domain-containing protein n=1 Tax=uncultured Selenomonas sp. TaxID=159275 RepID=UPI002675EE97|nr:helix-turn-helix domain-containing protein [uncultured Selenomonas sp.]
MSIIQDSNMQVTEERIRQYPESILERGYGMVGKYVMQDRELHVIAKAIYSYVCTFGNGAFPGRDKICDDLQINKSTYAKYMKQLVDYGYITIVQTRGEHQTFCRNVYEVNLNPQRVLELRAEEAKKAVSAPSNTVDDLTVYGETIHGETLEKSPCPISPYTVKPATNNTSVVVASLDKNNKTTTSTTTRQLDKAEEVNVNIHSKGESNLEIQGDMPANSIDGQARSSAEGCIRDASADVLGMIGEFGVTEYVAKDFLIRYGESAVLAQCQRLRRLVAEGKVKNPGGWLRRALEEGYVDGKKIAEELAAKEKQRRLEMIAKRKAIMEAVFEEEDKESMHLVLPDECKGLTGREMAQAYMSHMRGRGG